MSLEEMQRIDQILEELAIQYATDEHGVFHLQDYTAFMAGCRAGLAANVQIKSNQIIIFD
jgi:hypothetical protein